MRIGFWRGGADLPPPGLPHEAPSHEPARHHYSYTAIVVHWLMALAILVNFFLGLYMSGLPFSMMRLKLFNYHKWVGTTILALATLRPLWRLTHRPPGKLAAPNWQHAAAMVTHAGLYTLLLVVLLMGWAYSSAAGFPLVVYGVLPLPDFVPNERALAESLNALHGDLAWMLFVLVALHLAAVGKHMIIDQNGLVHRKQ